MISNSNKLQQRRNRVKVNPFADSLSSNPVAMKRMLQNNEDRALQKYVPILNNVIKKKKKIESQSSEFSSSSCLVDEEVLPDDNNMKIDDCNDEIDEEDSFFSNKDGEEVLPDDNNMKIDDCNDEIDETDNFFSDKNDGDYIASDDDDDDDDDDSDKFVFRLIGGGGGGGGVDDESNNEEDDEEKRFEDDYNEFAKNQLANENVKSYYNHSFNIWKDHSIPLAIYIKSKSQENGIQNKDNKNGIPLYPLSNISKKQCALKLRNVTAKHKLSAVAELDLLILLKEILPNNSNLPLRQSKNGSHISELDSCLSQENIMRGVVDFDICPNGCVVYVGDDSLKLECPIETCKESRYTICKQCTKRFNGNATINNKCHHKVVSQESS